MNPRPFAWTAGLLLLAVGSGGFVPPIVFDVEDPLRLSSGVGHPQLLGLFPVSEPLNVIHILLGLWGLWSGRSLAGAVGYARIMALAALALTLFGMVPGLDLLFGLAPLYGNNVLLHGLLAVGGFLFGWLYRRPAALPEPARQAGAEDYPGLP